MSDGHINLKLFAAHHPDASYLSDCCNHYFNEHISIASLIPSPCITVQPFGHAHDEYEFLLPRTPLPMLVNSGAVYFGEVGYGYPVQSGRYHATRFRMSDIANDNIVVDKAYMDGFLADKGHPAGQFNARFPVTAELKTYLKLFKTEFNRGEERCAAKLSCLSALLCLTLIELGVAPGLDGRRLPSEYKRGIPATVEFLNHRYTSEVNMEELARMAGLSKNYFITAFKKAVGESPYAYLNKLRISQAKVLLETTDYPISGIAAKCGFQKTNSFSSLFKAVTEMTPSDYRASLFSGGL